MNSTKNIFVAFAIAALLLAGCGKDEARQAADAEAKPAPEKAPSAPSPVLPSAEPPLPEQRSAPNASPPTSQQARQRVMADIVTMIGNPEGGLTRDHWRQLRERYWLPGFDRVIRAPDSMATVQDLLETPKGKQPLVVQLLSGKFETQDTAEQDSLLAFHNMALVTAATGGASLPAALADRLADPNITRGDVILFEVFSDAFVDMPRREQVSVAELDQWMQLATAPNGLHRLLALRLFHKVAPKPEQWLEFYQLYLAEQDQGIIEEVANLAFMTAKPEAAVLLGEIRAKPSVVANSDFAAKLDRSIDFLTKHASRE